MRELRLIVRRSATKVVEIDVEPFVDLLVQLEVLLADLRRRNTLREGLHLSGSAVLVGAADIETLIAANTAVSEHHCQ